MARESQQMSPYVLLLHGWMRPGEGELALRSLRLIFHVPASRTTFDWYRRRLGASGAPPATLVSGRASEDVLEDLPARIRGRGSC
jgi:hypothetical protein